jgi:regulatory protein
MNKTMKNVTPEWAFSRAAHICSQKECCVLDIKRKLKKMQFSDTEVEKIINKLIASKYIDEKRFTRSFIADRLRLNKWGEQKIRLELKRRFIPPAIIESALLEVESSAFTESLPGLLEKKRETVTGSSEYEINTKLIRYALGRGFLMNDILQCLKAMSVNDLPDDVDVET